MPESDKRFWQNLRSQWIRPAKAREKKERFLVATLLGMTGVAEFFNRAKSNLLNVVVEVEFMRMGAHAHGIDLVLLLVADPGVDEILLEDAALEKELVIGL